MTFKLMKIGILLIAFIMLGCDKGQEDIIVIPKNYTGYILIIYDQVNGADPVYKMGKRVYKVPGNGILKTKLSANPGWIGIPEFYYDTIVDGNKITFKLDPRNLPTDSVVACGGTAGSVKKLAVGKEVIKFLEYYIGTRYQIDTARERVQKLDIVKLAE